jgi:L-gulonate 3-dehydrogenase
LSGIRRKISIVGAGLVGGGWAIVFARAGHPVSMFDVQARAATKALSDITASLEDLGRAGLIDDSLAVRARIGLADSLEACVADAVYIQESVFERLDAKRAVVADIDKVVGGDTLIGSSSSGIAASHFTADAACRARCLVAHPVNPPYLAPVVELVPAPWTAPETVGEVRALMESVGQAPITLSRETEGFVLNRLQGVLLMEAWRLVESGLASVADIDKTVSEGLGLRWSFLGPFATIDLNAPGGVADYAIRLGPLYRSIAASTLKHRVWHADLIADVEAQSRRTLPVEELAARRAWRDRRLMALAVHKRRMDVADPMPKSGGDA